MGHTIEGDSKKKYQIWIYILFTMNFQSKCAVDPYCRASRLAKTSQNIVLFSMLIQPTAEISTLVSGHDVHLF